MFLVCFKAEIYWAKSIRLFWISMAMSKESGPSEITQLSSVLLRVSRQTETNRIKVLNLKNIKLQQRYIIINKRFYLLHLTRSSLNDVKHLGKQGFCVSSCIKSDIVTLFKFLNRLSWLIKPVNKLFENPLKGRHKQI